MKNTTKTLGGGGHRRLTEGKRSGRQADLASHLKRSAFTLAEVLITLAIIGIVAALTIPTVVTKYNQHAQYTAFMKIYNTLTTSLNLAIAKNGDPSGWGFTGNMEDCIVAFNNNLAPFFNISVNCSENPDTCSITQDSKIKSLNSENSAGINSFYDNEAEGYSQTYLLQDGSLIQMMYDGGFMSFIVDTNGAAKGPNTWGRDVFYFMATQVGGKFVLFPAGLYLDENGTTASADDITNNENIYARCSTTEESHGMACGVRLLLEGKMDY